MINIMSLPYPDEIFYSWFGRYHTISGNSSYSYTAKELFGTVTHINSLFYPTNLNFLCSQLPRNLNITSDYIIQNHTLFPFFKPFISSRNLPKIILKMKNKNNFHIDSIISVNANNLFNRNTIKICRQCFKDDVLKYGEGYIHRAHQIPGCFICLKHNKLLEELDITKINSQNKFFSIEQYNDMFSPIELPFPISKSLILFTKEMTCVLKGALVSFNLEQIIAKYDTKLRISRYRSYGGKTYLNTLIKDFLNYYSTDLLENLSCNFSPRQNKNWISLLAENREKIYHPVMHLLFIKFLFGSIKNLALFNEAYLPFGNGPWPCLNKFCIHYQKPVIDHFNIKYKAKNKLRGIFQCNNCGYTYSIGNDNTSLSDTYKKRYVIDYGAVWEENFKKLITSQNYNFAELSKIISCSFDTIIRMAYKLNLNKFISTNSKAALYRYTNHGLLSDSKLSEYKKSILNYIFKNKTATRSEIHHDLNKEYSAIINKDREWFEQNMPKPIKAEPIKCISNGNRADWQSKDIEISKKVISAIEDLKKNTCLKITKALISRKIKYTSLESKKCLSKMPITSNILNNSLESYDEFIKRKIEFIIKNSFSNNTIKTASQIGRMLDLSPSYYKKLKSYIETTIDNYKNKY